MEIGAALGVQPTEGIIQHNIETRTQRSFVQGSEVLKPAPKITRELCHIDWNDTTRNIYNLIRGLSPYPAAFTELVQAGEATAPIPLKIFFGEKVEDADFRALLPSGSVPPGTILSDGKTISPSPRATEPFTERRQLAGETDGYSGLPTGGIPPPARQPRHLSVGN